jgi:putative intracellular protease/amidase
MTRILMVLTSRRELGDTGRPTGAWLEELAASYYVFRGASCEIDLASPQGGPAPLDPLSLEPPWLTASGERFLADERAMERVRQTLPLNAVGADDYAAIYLVGGAGSAWDFPADESLAALVGKLFGAGRTLAGVCHGVLGLTRALNGEGRPLVAGRAVTGISNAEEIMTGFDQVVPVLPESRLTELGAQYSCAPPLEAHVVADGNVLTGQNPASAAPLARAVLAQLTARERPS